MTQTINIKRNHVDFCRAVGLSGRLEIFELKQLADMEAVYKARCQEALGGYKDWCRLHDQQTDMIELLYGNLEGIMLRRRAEDAIRSYWIIRQDFRRFFHDYLSHHQNKTSYEIMRSAA